jgi:hypothetical protein
VKYVNYWVRFWVVVFALMAAVTTLLFLTISFVFPDAAMFGVDTSERLLLVLAGAAALGIVVWSSTTFGDVVTENPPGRD